MRVPTALAVLAACVHSMHAAYLDEKEYTPSQDVPLFPGLDCAGLVFTTGACGCSTVLHGARVAIQEGKEVGPDKLACPGCAAAGITAEYDDASAVLKLSGDKTIAEYAAAIASTTFHTSSVNGNERLISYNFGEGVYHPDMGRFYEYFPCPSGPGCSWMDAQTFCADKDHDVLGLPGYLASITSHIEMRALNSLFPEKGMWIGATDVGKEGEWRWVTGPADNCAANYDLTSDGPWRTACRLGAPLNGKNPCITSGCRKGMVIGVGIGASFKTETYSHFASTEPNELEECAYGSCEATGEDYAYMKRNGHWYDMPKDYSEAEGFLCEWGGPHMGELCMETPDGEVMLRIGCGHHRSPTACTAAYPPKGCAWDGATCKASGCNAHTEIRDCTHDSNCVFDTSEFTRPATCAPERCREQHRSKTTCNADTSCSWNSVDEVCQPLICQQITDKCDCLALLPTCDWNIDDPSQPHCAPKEHCPASDMLFLLPSTPALATRWGVYNHGRDGLVESLRRWETASELSKSAATKTGMRMTFLTYGRKDTAEASASGVPASFTEACPGYQWVAPKGPGTLGAFSGDRKELWDDLDFHESLYCKDYAKEGTYIAPALEKARELFAKNSVGTRKKYVFVMTDTPFADGDAGAAVREELKKEGVQVFGVVLRRSHGGEPIDRSALASVKAIVSEPIDEHVQSVVLEEIEDEVLAGICNPHGHFGKHILQDSDVPRPCDDLKSQNECQVDGNARCQWDILYNECIPSKCHPICTEAECNDKLGCTWAATGGGVCEPRYPKCDGRYKSTCEKDELCVWNPAWASGCQFNPCAMSVGKGDACRQTMLPMKDCSPPLGDPEYCLVQVCDYDRTSSPSCKPRKCVATTEAQCTRDEECMWHPTGDLVGVPSRQLADYCRQDRCHKYAYNSWVCRYQDDCEYRGGDCVERSCAALADERECSKNARCKWDVHESKCADSKCAFVTDCDASEICMIDYKGDCVEKMCSKYNDDKCLCTTDPECVWVANKDVKPLGGYCVKPSMASCPDADIAMLLDASGSMRRTFGSHSHGFYGLCETLRDWILEAPLSGDDHTVGKDARRGGFRIALMQFSYARGQGKPDHPSGCAVGQCTDGLLSGDRKELALDLDWHETNFAAGWTYLYPAFVDVAEKTFAPRNSPHWRKHIVMVIADGGLTDYDGDACCRGRCDGYSCRDRYYRSNYNQELMRAQQLLADERVEVFGVILRRFTYQTFDDENAYTKLRPLVSQPADTHILSVYFDYLKEDILDTLCDPTSPFGSNLVTPEVGKLLCNGWGLEDECNADENCIWVTPQRDNCGDDQPNACPGLGCRDVPPNQADLGYTCADCKLERGVVTCGRNIHPNREGSCENARCLTYCNRVNCDSDPECSWHAADIPNPTDSDGECKKVVCDGLEEKACENEYICEFKDSIVCKKKPCVSKFVKGECVATPDCFWDGTASPALCKPIPKCETKGAGECETDSSCTWLCDQNRCIDTLCPYNTEDECDFDEDCEWTSEGCFLVACYNSRAQTVDDCKTCDGCRWKDVTSECVDDHCKDQPQDKCEADVTCKWDRDAMPAQCVVEPCADLAHGSDPQGDCEANPRCDWDKSRKPAHCVPNPCADKVCQEERIVGMIDPNADPRCKYAEDDEGEFCVEKECNLEDSSCWCSDMPGCFWDETSLSCKEESQAHCPDFDLVVLVDGSTAMANAFGKSPSGFQGQNEVLRRYMTLLPLSGDAASVGAATTATGGRVRVTFRQFGADNEGAVCKEAGCTGGAPSGNLEELNADINWQNANYQRSQTGYLVKAFEKAVADLKAAQTASHPRMKVVLVVVGDEPSDSSAELTAARSAAIADGVAIYGHAVRRSTSSTPESDAALQFLLSFVSTYGTGTDHVKSTELQTQSYDDWCNPMSEWGAALHAHNDELPQAATHGSLPCQYWTNTLECRADSSCVWEEPAVCDAADQCPQINCLTLSKEITRAGLTCRNCKLVDGRVTCKSEWDFPALPGRCKEGPCAPECFGNCFSVPECEWHQNEMTCSQKVCDHEDPKKCEADDLCETDDADNCVRKPCVHFTPGACLKEDGCEWDPEKEECYETDPDCEDIDTDIKCDGHPSGKCEWDCSMEARGCLPNPCPYDDAGACTGAAACVWEEDVCRRRRCTGDITSEAVCTQDPPCRWDAETKTCTENVCHTHQHESTCMDDARCKWDAEGCGACVPTRCTELHPTEDGCGDEPTEMCHWDPTTSPAACVDLKCKDYDESSMAAGGTLCDCKDNPLCHVDTRDGGAVCIPKKFQACPDMDIMIALPGQCTMRERFSKHANGFEAVMAGLQDFIGEIPLTGEAAAEASTAQGTRAVRIGLQMWDKGVRVAECPQCACNPAPAADGSGIPTLSAAGGAASADGCGALTGRWAELREDIHWALKVVEQDNGCRGRSTASLKETYELALARFATAPKYRKRVLFVATDGGVVDNAELTALKQKLMDADVLVLGVHVYGRRGATTQVRDLEDYSALQAAMPASGVTQQLTVDGMRDALYNICDKTTPFGVHIADPKTELMCEDITNSLVCMKDRRCEWDAITSTCHDHPCYHHCGDEDCEADGNNNCKFDADSHMCGKTLCEEVSSPGKCKELECRWDNADTPPCTVTHCPADTEDACWLLPNDCEWQEHPDGTASCEKIPCNHGDAGECNADRETGCDWVEDACGGTCYPKKCTAITSAAECNGYADGTCEWTAALTCESKACTNIREEECCEETDGCTWTTTTSPGSCTTKPCGPLDPKRDDPACRTCADLDQCECKNNPDCWFVAGIDRCVSADMGLCPDMDVVVMLDAQRETAEEFGRHPNGFSGLLEIVREWSADLPMTGAAGAKGGIGAGSQISIVQFAGTKVAGGSAVATGFTGQASQVAADVNTHNTKWLGQESVVDAGIKTAAAQYDGMDAVAHPDRKRVVLLFLHQETIDNAALLENQIDILRNTGASVFGVSLRRQTAVLRDDAAAAAQLATITGAAERVQELTIYDVYERVFLDLCDPEGVFGKTIRNKLTPPQPCSRYTDAVRCNQDEGCMYESTSLQCLPNECSKRCDEEECVKPVDSNAPIPPTCEWVPGTGECWEKKVCEKKDEAECKMVQECKWIPAVGCVPEPCTPNGSEQECMQDAAGCEWIPELSPACIKACDWDMKELCEDDPKCRWETNSCSGGVEECAMKPADCSVHATEDDCSAARTCEWDAASGTCARDPCDEYSHSEECCDVVPAPGLSCEWKVTNAPAGCTTEPCSKHGEETCEDSGSCEWDGDSLKCVPVDCDGKDVCDCAQRDGCFWMASPAPGKCVNDAYSTCPPTDYVVVVDGSNIMQESFSRHPQGFFATMAALKDWVGDLPLTNTPAGTAAGAPLSRAAIIAYNGIAGRSARALKAPAGTGAAGRLSGLRAELEADIDWQTESFSAVQAHGDPMLEAGLMAAADLLAAAKAPERRRAVIVVSADGFADGAKLGDAHSKLMSAGAEVYGVALRRGVSSTPADIRAEGDLKLMLPSPAADRFVNVEVDRLVPTLMALCDDAATWGKVLRAAPGGDLTDLPQPCSQQNTKHACMEDARCVWSETLAQCTDSPCVKECDEVECNANTVNLCHWDSVDASCKRFPDPDKDCECHIDTPNEVYNKEQCEQRVSQACVWDAAAKTCVKDDCLENIGEGWAVCSGKGQVCVDNDKSACEAKWVCECAPPAKRVEGTEPEAALAHCYIDECVFDCETCHGTLAECGEDQECIDVAPYDPADTRDWQCVCKEPFAGAATAGAAVCKLNECKKSCDWCENGMVCPEEQGQVCYEPDETTKMDWVCACPPPLDKRATMMAVDNCDYDECETPENKEKCASVGQVCEDHDVSERNKWMCVCVPPFVGNQTRGEAVCSIDECEATCDTCEEDACAKVGQECEDANRLSTQLNDWKCKCPPPSRGEAIAGPATCELDECIDTCPTCEKGLCPEGQTCHDPHKTPDKTSDWYCQCREPSVTLNMTNAVVVCEYDECSEEPNEKTCADAGQVCVDPAPSLDSRDDWECHCVVPPATAVNPAVMKPAECEFPGECVAPPDVNSNPEARKCIDDGHLCDDPDPMTPNTFICKCVPPTSDATFDRAAGVEYTSDALNCTLDECKVVCATCMKKHDDDEDLCERAGQKCVDRDHKALDSWQCECVGDFVTGTPGRPAECELDECVDASLNKCPAEQECVDAERAVDATGTYVCSCTEGVGEKTGGPATCVCDECLTNACPGGSTDPFVVPQRCHDLDQTCPGKDDWTCTCELPFAGSQVAGVARCEVDECKEHGGTCTAVGQTCSDKTLTLLGDWYCECVLPATGAQRQGAAECHLNECNTTVVIGGTSSGPGEMVCGDQECIDMDMSAGSTGDWVCKCEGDDGETAPRARADCVVDECDDHADDCLVNCGEPSSVNCQQTCYDPAPRRASAMDNWKCLCPTDPPSVGVPGEQGPAVCTPPNPCDCDTEECCLRVGDVCEWSCDAPQRCSKKACPGATETSCTAVDGCMWATAGAGTAYIPGIPAEAFAGITCGASGSVALTITITDGYVSEKDALVCPGCTAIGGMWDAASGTLTTASAPAADLVAALKTAAFETLSVLGAPRTLTWSAGSCSGEVRLVRGYCEPQRCQHAEAGACGADEACSWTGTACEVNHCAQHPNEVLCVSDPQCYFDTTTCPVMCREKYCPKTHTTNGVVKTTDDRNGCTNDPKCRVDRVDGKETCVTKVCGDITDRCECHTDPDCYWRKGSKECVTLQYGACPAMDVVVAVDGSASMGGVFGRHPHGFYATVEALRSWTAGLPLGVADRNARVAFVQYAEDGSAKAPRMGLSGDADELTLALDHMEEQYMAGASEGYVQGALEIARDMFEDSPVGRTRALFIIADSAVSDNNAVATVLKDLAAMDVQVFALGIRRRSAMTDADATTEASLSALVSEPTTGHFASIEIDAITLGGDDSPLVTMCDPTSVFGKYIAIHTNQDVPCHHHVDRDACVDDVACTWGAISQTCGPTPCLQHCDSTTCNADEENNCLWDAAVPDCYEKRKCYATTPAECTSPECVWDETAPAGEQCTVNPCGHETEAGCLSQTAPECEWDCSTSLCTVRKCAGDDATACGASTGCVFIDGTCITEPCTTTNATACEEDARCMLASGTCRTTACGAHPTAEACEADMACEFNHKTCPAACVEKTCPKGYCTCGEVTDACVCNEDPECYWSAKRGGCVDADYGACPTLDVVVLFDGSAHMTGWSGAGSSSYAAVMRSLEHWADALPLSGEAAGAKPTANSNQVRVAFVQYSGTDADNGARRAPSGAGRAAGKLSGDKAEVFADLAWHSANIMAKGRYLAAGLNTARRIFEDSPNDGRRRAVFVLGSGELDDASMLAGTAESLRSMAEVYGVVTRRFEVASPTESAAEEDLRGLVSLPRDGHFASVEMTAFASGAAPLNTLCDPSTPFGAHLADTGSATGTPCHQHASFAACAADTGCVYSEANLRCENTPCLVHCDKSTCDADTDNTCAWTGGECTKKPPCEGKTKTACRGTTCEWAADTDKCVVNPCGLVAEDACHYQESPVCEFKDGTCDEKKCVAENEVACVSLPPADECEWKNEGCKQRCTEPGDNECACKDEYECAEDEGCRWNTAGSPAICEETYCRKTHAPSGTLPDASAEAACNGDVRCTADDRDHGKICRERVCSDITDRCECYEDSDCTWRNSDGTCVDSRYGLCPTVDIVVLFDGSGSMVKQFGRHPHGYYALMSVFKSWLTDLPLSGEKAGAPSTSLTRRARVAFVQYSGTYDGTKAVKAPAGVGTGGRLSGDLDELLGDVEWHAANHMAKQTYIQEGLQMTAELLTMSPNDGRRRAVYIIGDGRLDDAAKVAEERDALMRSGPEVFAIGIRRGPATTDFDQNAIDSLGVLTTAPQGNHVISVAMDELAGPDGPLTTICDPTSKFGKYLAIADGERPCHQYSADEASACAADKGCAWVAADTTCVRSPCLKHCAEAPCNDDATCEWDASVQTCYARPGCIPQPYQSCAAFDNRRVCVADAGCVWDDVALNCTTHSCTAYCDEKTCTADAANGCAWDADDAVCRGKPLCTEAPTRDECPEVECVWDDATGCTVNPCGHTTEAGCAAEMEPECVFVDGTCVEKPCQLDEQACQLSKDCEWTGDTCVEQCMGPSKDTCACQTDEATCTARDDCDWEAPNVCKDKEKCDVDTEAECMRPECVWAQDTMDVPAGCKPNPCYTAVEVVCKADDQCEWTGMDCKYKECQYTSETLCEAHADAPEHCKWYKEEGVCGKKPCVTATDRVTCEDDVACEWDAMVPECKEKPCAQHKSITTCHAEAGCVWDVETSMPVCKEDYCRETHASGATGEIPDDAAARRCDDDDKCVVKTVDGKRRCEEKTCADTTDKCACGAEDGCFWLKDAEACVSTQFGACPTLDIVVLFDGSGSMIKQFGRHENGFVATMETLKLWVTQLPLSGEKAGVAPAEASMKTRAAFVQFSGSYGAEIDARKTPAGVGTGGRFSGDAEELLGDLTWHEENFFKRGTFVVDGLNMAADLFATSPRDGRKRVLYVISDGKFDDETRVGPALGRVRAHDVEVFGIVVRNEVASTEADQRAVESMKTLVSEPVADHWVNLDLDTMTTAESPLATLCDPTSKFGKYLAVPDAFGMNCGAFADRMACLSGEAARHCVWSDEDYMCSASTCTVLCGETACKDAINPCHWDAADAECYERPPCAGKIETACSGDCMWDTTASECVPDPCGYSTEWSCDRTDGCSWDADAEKCDVTPCTYATEGECNGVEECEWVDDACAVKKACEVTADNHCRCLEDDLACNSVPGCLWDIEAGDAGLCMETYCRHNYGKAGVWPAGGYVEGAAEAACEEDPACTVREVNGRKTCDAKKCADNAGKCACRRDDACVWLAEDETCVAAQYGACPTLDLAVLFDGSGSMSKNFGHHPHGFRALVEAMKTWVAGLPLSGEAAGVPAAAHGVRVAFIQYGGQLGKPTSRTAPAGVGAGGRFSGDAGELLADLDWHEANYFGKQTYIADGLSDAVELFRDAPTDGRHRALYIISDGRLDDEAASAVKAKEFAALSHPPHVFGIVVRRFAQSAEDDRAAVASLRHVVSAPQEDHLLNIDMDHMGQTDGPLSRICDPADRFGKYLAVGGTGACVWHTTRDVCMHDHACAWTPDGCKQSPCRMHCDEAVCPSDACEWDSTTSECNARPPCTGTTEETCGEAECMWTGEECLIDPCGYTSTEQCNAEDDCVWREYKCVSKLCDATVPAKCDGDHCVWRDDVGICQPKPPVRPCVERGEATCEGDSQCSWEADRQRCVIHRSRGTCSDCYYCRLGWGDAAACRGCEDECSGCTCEGAWSGPHCDVCATNVVRTYDDAGAAIYECPVCDARTTCSGHGVCSASGACVCDTGYMGVDCASRYTCAPAGAYWVQSHPAAAVAHQPTTLAVHGCFDAARSVKVIPAGAGAAGAYRASGDDVCNTGAVVREDCTSRAHGDLMHLDGDCTRGIAFNNATVARSGNELLVKLMVPVAQDVHVCWRDEAAGMWRLVPTQQNDTRAAVVSFVDNSSGKRGAAAGAGLREVCCIGWRFGAVCLPSALVLAVFVMFLVGCGYVAYEVSLLSRNIDEAMTRVSETEGSSTELHSKETPAFAPIDGHRPAFAPITGHGSWGSRNLDSHRGSRNLDHQSVSQTGSRNLDRTQYLDSRRSMASVHHLGESLLVDYSHPEGSEAGTDDHHHPHNRSVTGTSPAAGRGSRRGKPPGVSVSAATTPRGAQTPRGLPRSTSQATTPRGAGNRSVASVMHV